MVTIVVKDVVGAAEVVDTLVGMLVIDVLTNAVNAVAITLALTMSVSCSVDVLSDGAVDLLMDVLAGVLTGVVIVGLANIGVGVLVEVNVNMFAWVMTEVKFVLSGVFAC